MYNKEQKKIYIIFAGLFIGFFGFITIATFTEHITMNAPVFLVLAFFYVYTYLLFFFGFEIESTEYNCFVLLIRKKIRGKKGSKKGM